MFSINTKQQYSGYITNPPTTFWMFSIFTEFQLWEYSYDNYSSQSPPTLQLFFQCRRFHCLGRAFSKDVFVYMAIMFLSSIRHPSGWVVMKVLIIGVSKHPLQNENFRNSVQGDFTSDFTASKCYWFYLKKRTECFECFNNFTFSFFVPIFQSCKLWSFQMGF